MLANGWTEMTKANPAQYCIWCEEKLATKEQFPHCSCHCKDAERKAKK